MEYDRHVAILQGSILGFETQPLAEHDRYLRLSNVLDSLLNIDRVITRKIFMCLLLNTDLSELEEMRKVPEYAPLSDLFRIPINTFMKLITGNWWQTFIEAIPVVIPCNILNKIICSLAKDKEILNSLGNESDRYTKVLAFTVAVILAMKLCNPDRLEKIDNTIVNNLIDIYHDISLKTIALNEPANTVVVTRQNNSEATMNVAPLFNTITRFADVHTAGLVQDSMLKWNATNNRWEAGQDSGAANTSTAHAVVNPQTSAKANTVTFTREDGSFFDCNFTPMLQTVDKMGDVNTTVYPPAHHQVLRWESSIEQWIPGDVEATSLDG